MTETEKTELREILQAFHVQAFNLLHAAQLACDDKLLTDVLSRTMKCNDRIRDRLMDLVEQDDCMQ